MVKQKVVEDQDEDEPVEDKKKGRGRKRIANSKPQYNDVSADFIYYALLCKYVRLYSLDVFLVYADFFVFHVLLLYCIVCSILHVQQT